MPINNIYSMTDLAIAKDIGLQIEQLRLEANISQKYIADELGITVKTYRNIKLGKAKFELVIGVLRILGQLEVVNNFIPKIPYSPLKLLELNGQKRQRVSRSVNETHNTSELNGEEPSW
jgi:transcriptional regulator with XRE-family HTH domain